jgi:hypothetical protein
VPKNRAGSMISKRWVKQTRAYFLTFLRETKFPELDRHADRDEAFHDPEWLIMLIGVLAVRSQEKTYLGIHRLSTRYWNELCGGAADRASDLGESVAGAIKKNQLPTWKRCRIHSSNFSTRVLAIRWSVRTR